jgi:hypothetical protein
VARESQSCAGRSRRDEPRPWQARPRRSGPPAELTEWLAFAALRDRHAEAPLRALLASYELFACCEGLAEVPELTFVRHLESLGLPRRGATFGGLRLHSAIPPLRLLTRLELYGFRFALEKDDLVWHGPECVTDLELKVIAHHRRELAAALAQVEERRQILRGSPARGHLAPPCRLIRSAA